MARQDLDALVYPFEAGTSTVRLIRDRKMLNDLDVPEDVEAVVVLQTPTCKHVLSTEFLKRILGCRP